MKPYQLAVISFVVGAITAGTLTYVFKPSRAAITERDMALINKKTTESSFPTLTTAKWQARQAMDFFEHRKDEAKTAELCSRAIASYLDAIKSTLERGDMYFMADAIESDREKVLGFLEAHPELKR